MKQKQKKVAEETEEDEVKDDDGDELYLYSEKDASNRSGSIPAWLHPISIGAM